MEDLIRKRMEEIEEMLKVERKRRRSLKRIGELLKLMRINKEWLDRIRGVGDGSN